MAAYRGLEHLRSVFLFVGAELRLFSKRSQCLRVGFFKYSRQTLKEVTMSTEVKIKEFILTKLITAQEDRHIENTDSL
ncbi:MAG: hypothetical protein MJE63_12090, partial [Proteobacteria bacterium]|nr:hypothetical protein [Pseudomonadota bacterium]